MTPNEQFIIDMRDVAQAANHVWPEYASCEVALETAKTVRGAAPHSNFGRTQAFLQGNNPFGNQQPREPVFNTLRLLAWEEKHGQRVNVIENFISFPDLATAFNYRMETLKRLPSIYGDALAAKTGEDFIMQVSAQWESYNNGEGRDNPQEDLVYKFSAGYFRFIKGRWSTGSGRAKAVLDIYRQYKHLFVLAEAETENAVIPKSEEKDNGAGTGSKNGNENGYSGTDV